MNILTIITIFLMNVLSGAEVDLFIPSFPELQKIFNLTPFLAQLTLSVNFTAYCICSLICGSLGDKYGKKQVIIAGLIIFIIGSICATLAEEYYILLIGRMLQGIGISAPTVLGILIIMEELSSEKQPKIIGIMTGATTITMAIAPVIGSYVNLYFGWRGNFKLLLILGLICLILGIFFVPNKKNVTKKISTNISYYQLLSTKKVFYFVSAFCFIVIPYWMFVGMAPILYMDSLGVSLKDFGFYQGASCSVFGVVSIFSGKIISKYGQVRSFNMSLIIYLFISIIMLISGLNDIRNPLYLTLILIILSGTAVIPVNLLFITAINSYPDASGKISAMITSGRLILTSLCLQIVSYFYYGSFSIIAVAMFLAFIISIYFIMILKRNNWLKLEN